MKLSFIKANPSENMTVFVLDPLPREQYKNIAGKIMEYGNVYAEQVGFVEKPSSSKAVLRLQMMGGEFCGNASRALAAAAVLKEYPGIKENKGIYTVPLEVSGFDGVLACKVEPVTSNGFNVSVKMPPCLSLKDLEIRYEGGKYKGMLIDLPGISHAVFFTEDENPDEGFFEAVRASLENFDYEAFGIMFYNEKENFMRPLVYVKGTDSLIWEKSCGSGTEALGMALLHLKGENIDMNVRQPGGTVKIKAIKDNKPSAEIFLEGMVYIAAEGQLYI